jgi:hypothetical protein
LHTRMFSEPMNRTAVSNETETLWHVEWGFPHGHPIFGATNLIWCSWRRGTSLPVIIHAPNSKTPNTTCKSANTNHQTWISSDPETDEMTRPPVPRGHRLEQRQDREWANAVYSRHAAISSIESTSQRKH